jgi:hypothetical protein
MPSGAVFGRNTQFKVDLGSGYVLIPECKAITPGTPTPDEEDVTNQDTAGNLKEFVRTGIDYGEVTADCNYLPEDSVHQQLIADMNSTSEVQRDFQILLTGGGRAIEFTGTVTAFARELPHDGVYKANLRVRIRSVPVENPTP